jgi:hypothetical protein
MDINHVVTAKEPTQTVDPNEPILVGITTCLRIVFPDAETRPSLRSFNEWKQRGYFPSVKIGKRVFLDPSQVRKALERRFTIEAI